MCEICRKIEFVEESTRMLMPVDEMMRYGMELDADRVIQMGTEGVSEHQIAEGLRIGVLLQVAAQMAWQGGLTMEALFSNLRIAIEFVAIREHGRKHHPEEFLKKHGSDL